MEETTTRATVRDLMLERWFRDRNSGRLVWVTGSGVEIPVKDMTNEHLNNAIAHEKRKLAELE